MNQFGKRKKLDINDEMKNICLEYSDESETLKKILNNLSCYYTLVGQDDQYRYKYNIELSYKDNRLCCPFTISINDSFWVSYDGYGDSYFIQHAQKYTMLYNSYTAPSTQKRYEKRKEIKNHLLYNVLTSLKSEYYCSEEFLSFEDFCNEFYYESRLSDYPVVLQTYNQINQQIRELKNLFSDTEILSFPN